MFPDVSLAETDVERLVCRHVPQATLVESYASELTFKLPDDPASVKKFEGLFSEIDANLDLLGISGYGVSSTSLEEVSLIIVLLLWSPEG